MASKVIAEMAVRLGMDPAEFLEKMKGVPGSFRVHFGRHGARF